MRRQNGFSLLELLIALAVFAIMASIAYPSYVNYAKKGKRSAAQQLMLEAANLQEQFLLDNRAYTTVLGSGGLNLTVPSTVSKYYNVTLSSGATPPTFTVTATPKAGTQMAGESTLTINHLGVKEPSGDW